MQMYVNFYDRNVKLDDENKTIGIILCKDKNQAVVEMTLPEDNTQIFASKYQTVLPSKEEAATQKSVLTVLLLDDAAQAAYIPPHFSCLVAYPDHTGKLTLQQHGGGKQHET